jgi:predicted HicB family RNase H-like nuclease
MANKDKQTDNQHDLPALLENEYSSISLRIPSSLHRFLVEEAYIKGISLNRLIVAKISLSLYDMIKNRK